METPYCGGIFGDLENRSRNRTRGEHFYKNRFRLVYAAAIIPRIP